MLTREQAIARYDYAQGRILPDRLMRRTHGRYLRRAERMLEVYRRGIGCTRQALHRRVRAIFDGHPDCPPRRMDAFCKLLDDRSVYDGRSRGAAARLRREVFRRAASHHPLAAGVAQGANHHLQVKNQIAAELGTTWQQIDQQLFADTIELQRLAQFDGYDDPAALLARYNVAQVQAALYDALCMDVDAGDDFKTILRFAKLAGLMHNIEACQAERYKLRLNGPASVLRTTRRYGAAFARFVPALVACRDWRMRALVARKGWTLRLDLASDDGLTSHLPPPEEFDSRVEELLAKAWGDQPREGWRLAREGVILWRGQNAFVPDFVLRHADGREALLEIVGFWTPEYLKAKAETLQAFAGERILLAVAEALRSQAPALAHDAIWYRSAVPVEAVLARLRRER